MRRRTALATAGALLTGTVAGCVDTPERTATPAGGVDEQASRWPQIGGDAQHTRSVDARGPRDSADIAWDALNRRVYPPVVGDALYLSESWTDGAALSIGTDDGGERWLNGDLPPSRWAPALGEDHLFVLSRTDENVVRLHALATETGEQSWVREEGITAASSSRPPIGPTVRGGSVVVASERGLVGCDAATGGVEWSVTLGPDIVEIEGGTIWGTEWAKPAVTGERAFTFDRNDDYGPTREVHAVDWWNGEHEWTTELETGDGWSLQGHAVAGGGRVFVVAADPVTIALDSDAAVRSGRGRLFALDATSGDLLWDRDLAGVADRPPAYADGTLYVGEWLPDPDTGRLSALDAGDGSTRWAIEANSGVGSPAVAADTVYTGQGEELVATSRETGEERWRLDAGEWISPPIVVGDTAYVQTEPGHDYDSRILAVREP